VSELACKKGRGEVSILERVFLLSKKKAPLPLCCGGREGRGATGRFFFPREGKIYHSTSGSKKGEKKSKK